MVKTVFGARYDFFEVSFEVANKVGGIYAVLSSKAAQMVQHYGNDY